MENKLYYGTSYYPESWDDKTIEEDIHYMKELGINIIRMGSFSWDTLEPQEGNFDFSFHRRIIERLHQEGIETILATPTAMPPAWMVYKHPEKHSHEAKQDTRHYCINNPYYQERVKLLVEEMASQLGELPGILAWQIDHELQNTDSDCYCDTCISLWHKWLKKKYKTIDNLNRSWGYTSRNRLFQTFAQIPAPSTGNPLQNLCLKQAYKTFFRESAAKFCFMQADIIRRHSSAPVTHNSNSRLSLDNAELFSKLDFSICEEYSSPDRYSVMLREYDYYRPLSRRFPFWAMEEMPERDVSSFINCSKPHPAGYRKAMAAAAYFSGAQGYLCGFWRQNRSLQVLSRYSSLYSWGKPTTAFSENSEAIAIKNELEPYLKQTHLAPRAVAVVYSDLARKTFLTEPLDGFKYRDLIQEFYEDYIPKSVNRDLISESAPLDDYSVLLTPYMASLTDEFLEKAISFVKKGGTWIAGPLCNFRTPEHTVPTNGGWGKLEAYAGASVKHTVSFTGTGSIAAFGNSSFPVTGPGVVFEPTTAKADGYINSSHLRGEVILTAQKLGFGTIYLLGAKPETTGGKIFVHTLIIRALFRNATMPCWESTEGIFIRHHLNELGESILYAVDLEGNGGYITPAKRYEILVGEPCGATVWVKPYGYAILKLPKN